MRRSLIPLLLSIALFNTAAHGEEERKLDPAEAAALLDAARALAASDPSGEAPVQPAQAQVILEATEEGGKAKAVMGFELVRSRVALELSAPLQSGASEADFVTLDRVPGEAVARTSFAFEVGPDKPAEMVAACGVANRQVLESYRELRGTLRPIVLSPPADPSKASLAALRVYARAARHGLNQSAEHRPAAFDAELAARNAVCAAVSAKQASQYVPDLIGLSPAEVSDLLPGREHRTCSLAGASALARAEATVEAAATAIARLYPATYFAAAVQKIVEEEVAKLPVGTTPEETAKVAEEVGKAALVKLRAERQAQIRKELLPAALSSLEAAHEAFEGALVSSLENLLRTATPPLEEPDVVELAKNAMTIYDSTDASPRPDALERALLGVWPLPPSAGRVPGAPSRWPAPEPATGISSAKLPPAVSEELQRQRADASDTNPTMLAKAEALEGRAFGAPLLAALAALKEPPTPWGPTEQAAIAPAAAKAAGTDPVAESAERAYLEKLVPAYATLVTAFNQLPFDQLIERSEGICGVAQIEARIAAMPRGPQRRELFAAYNTGLPTLVFLTVSGQAGSVDFKWLASFPPTIEENKILTEKDTRYNTGIAVGVSAFFRGWYTTAAYSRLRTYTALPAVNVCLPLTGGTPGTVQCTDRSPGPPRQAEPEVLELSTKRFWSPTLATHLQALYSLDSDTFNPHAYLYFLPQKDKGLRGGLDLSYLRNHPTEEDRFQARIFIGTPLKLRN